MFQMGTKSFETLHEWQQVAGNKLMKFKDKLIVVDGIKLLVNRAILSLQTRNLLEKNTS